jgi:parallel beta-helix repeat protein
VNKLSNKKIALPAVFICILFLLCNSSVSANFLPPPPGTAYGLIYIDADGNISPQNLPISRSGNVYTLTGNITNYGFKIQRDNVVIDGANFVIQATDWYAPSTGVVLENQNGVTIKNLVITGFTTGVLLNKSTNNIIEGNMVVSYANSNDAISILNGSTNNTFSQNYLYGSVFLGHGIYIDESAGNKFRNNTVSNGQRSYYWPSTNKFNFLIECSNTSSPVDLVQDIDSSNILDGKPMCYWVNQHDKVVPSGVAYVALVNCSGITAQNLNLTNNGQGLLLVSTTNSTFRDNNITGNNQGIVLLESSNNTFTDNNIAKNVYGFTLYSSYNSFLSNRFIDNERESANFQNGYMNSIDSSNTVNGAPLCYWVNQQDKTVPSNVGYVFLVNCSRIIVQNLTIKNQQQGLCLVSTTNSLIINNIITDNEYGICINQSSNNKVVKNQLTGNLANSIYLYSSHGNIVSENQITQGFVGLYVANSTNNIFSRNNIIENNYTGVDFFGSSDNKLLENRIENEGRAGISMEYLSNNNLIVGNNVANNRFCSVDLNNAQNNTFYHNNFKITLSIRNGYYLTHQILDINAGLPVPSLALLSQNKWDNGVEGNFWSDYNGTDQNGDGIGDTPHIIDTSLHAPPLLTYNGSEPFYSLGNNTTLANVNGTINQDRHPLTSEVNFSSELQLTVLSPENKAYDSENVPLTFAVDQSDLQVNYSLDQQTDLAANTNITLSGLLKGSHYLLVWTTDASGNPTDYQIINFIITKETATLQTAQPSPNETSSANDFPLIDWAVVGLVLTIIVVLGLAAYFKKYHN